MLSPESAHTPSAHRAAATLEVTRLQTLWQHMSQRLQSAGIASARLDARLLVQHALGISHEQLIAEDDRRVLPHEVATIERLMVRRLAREPLAQIIGRKAFWRDEFIVSADVLSPRPESETLIDGLLQHCRNEATPETILDFGTGSGCLLLSLLREYPQARGMGVDISPAALAVARQNAVQLGLAGRAEFQQGNWGETLQTSYDMIISNPPYIAECDVSALAPEVVMYEPEWALTGGPDGLAAYRALLPHLARALKPGGIAAMECGEGQATAVADLAAHNELSLVTVMPDLRGIRRALIMQSST